MPPVVPRSVLLLGLLCVAGSGRAQPLLEHFGRAHGLPSDYVLALLQSRSGYLWMGTDAGLVRYDGSRFETFTPDDGLPHAYVTALAQGRGDTLWVGTNGGLAFFDGLHVQPVPQAVPSQGSVANIVADGRGQIAVQHIRGLSVRDAAGRWRVDPGGYCLESLVASRAALRLHPDGTAELVCGNGQMRQIPRGRVAGARWLPVTPENPSGVLGTRILNDYVRLELTARDGTHYAASREGVFTLGPATTPVWRGHVENLIEDYEGSVWFGTFGRGLYRIRSLHLTALTRGNALRFTQAADGTLWATGDTLVAIDPASRRVRRYAGLPGTRAGASRDGLYFGTSTNLFRWSDLQRYRHKAALVSMSGWVSGLAFQGDTLLASSYGNGLVRLLGDHPLDTLGLQEGLPTSTLEDVSCFSSGCWLFTRSHGVLRLRGRQVKSFGKAEGLPSSTTFSAHQRGDGSVWVGTDQGLGRIVGDGVQERVGGLLFEGQRVLALFERPAEAAVLWAVTDGGLVRVDAGGLVLRSPQPLAPPDASLNAAFYDAATDQLFVATTQGVMALRMAVVVGQRLPPPRAALHRVEVDGAPAWPRDTRLRLPHARARLTVEAALLSFAGPARGEYRLDQGAWQPLGTGHTVAFPRLAPGDYIFEMRAVNVEGRPSDLPVQLPFYVPPLWWQRTPVLALLILLALAVVILGMRALAVRRVRRLEAEQHFHREREHLARDLHDYVGGQLATLVTATELVELSARRGDASQMSAYAEAAGMAARQTLFQVRQTVHTLRSDALSARDLYEQIHGQAQAQLRFVAQPTLRAQFSAAPGATPDTQALRASVALQVLRIAQEALTNVLRHARACTVEVHVLAEAHAFVLCIEDDGVGLNGQAHGNGRTIMRNRAAEIGASLVLGGGREGQGTRVLLRVPFDDRNR